WGGPLRRLSSSERRERSRLEDPALLALVRAQLAALREVLLERGIGHERIALPFAVRLARVLPHAHHLVQRSDLGRRVEHGLAAMLHLRGMAVLLVELEPGGELVVVQGVDAQIEDHVASAGPSIAFVASSARRARSSGASFCETGTSRLSGTPAGSAASSPRRSSPPSPGKSRSERAWRTISSICAGMPGRASQSCA